MNADGVAILADQIKTPIVRQLVVRHQVVDVDDAVLSREVIRARVERPDVRHVVLTAADQHRDLEVKVFEFLNPPTDISRHLKALLIVKIRLARASNADRPEDRLRHLHLALMMQRHVVHVDQLRPVIADAARVKVDLPLNCAFWNMEKMSSKLPTDPSTHRQTSRCCCTGTPTS